MKKTSGEKGVGAEQLRKMAEARLSALPARPARHDERDLTHELQVHQIELAMQNEALRQTQEALEESRDHYVDLYDFSPLGYLTLTRDGLIDAINLTGSSLLAVERKGLLSRRFASFVASEDQDRWHRYFLSVARGAGGENIELQLKRGDGTFFYARLDCLRVAIPLGASADRPVDDRQAGPATLAARKFEVRVALTNVTELVEARRAAEASALTLRALAAELTTAEERERRALAQDLHDNLGQLLAAIKIKLSMRDPCLNIPCPHRSLFEELEVLVDEVNKAARMLTLGLKPPILCTQDLRSTFEWLAEDIERKFGIAVRIHGDEELGVIDDTVRTIVFRAVRELLVNVAKHAGVAAADITCLADGQRLTVAVSDLGSGFLQEEVERAVPGIHGFGLHSTRERLSLIGGQMEIDSIPGEGTMVTLSVPLRSSGQRL
jgi:signal transduction histidine kinase